MSGLYDTDALAWSEQQAELLRLVASGERINEAVDWPNVIEEIASMGREQLRACTGLLRRGIEHIIKLHAMPDNMAADHWRGEILRFLTDASSRFSPSMRPRIDLAQEYARAIRLLRIGMLGPNIQKLPETCPWTLDDLLADPPDLAALVARLDLDASGRSSTRNLIMTQDETQKPDRTTANTPVSGTDPGGTRPAPSRDKPGRPPVESGDQNTDPDRSTDRT